MEDLVDALDLWTTTEPYSTFPAQTIAWRLMPALESGQYRVYRHDDGRPRGFISWAFMTRAEFDARDYSGAEIFLRKSGEHLVFVDMIAPQGANDVLFICRDMRRLFKDFPEIRRALAHRGRRNGIFPNIGG